MQLAIACAVTVVPDVIQSFEQRHELIEVLQSGDVLFANVLSFVSSHASEYTRILGVAQVYLFCVFCLVEH